MAFRDGCDSHLSMSAHSTWLCDTITWEVPTVGSRRVGVRRPASARTLACCSRSPRTSPSRSPAVPVTDSESSLAVCRLLLAALRRSTVDALFSPLINIWSTPPPVTGRQCRIRASRSPPAFVLPSPANNTTRLSASFAQMLVLPSVSTTLGTPHRPSNIRQCPPVTILC